MRRVSMAIHGRYAPAVLEKLLPNGESSKADYGEHAVDGRIQGRQPNLRSRLDESPRFYEGARTLLLAWVSCVSNWHSTLFAANLRTGTCSVSACTRTCADS